jgi:hypothetical protein
MMNPARTRKFWQSPEAVEVPVTLRKQRAVIERLAPDAPDPDKDTK